MIHTLRVIRQGIDHIVIVLKIQSAGIYWMIPLPSQIDKYRRIVGKKEKAGKCSYDYAVKRNNKITM